MNLFVGLDVSSETLEACFLGDQIDQVFLRTRFTNDTVGANQIKNEIIRLNAETHFKKIMIGMESTSLYSFHPAIFFQNDQELKALNVKTVIEDPRRVRKYAESYDTDKTDYNDAFIIADYLRIGRGTTSPMREEKFMALQRLTRSRYQLIQQLTETKQHFLENLCYKVNTLSHELDSVQVFSATTIELMTEELSIDDLANMPLEDLAELVQKKGHGRFKDPKVFAKTIQKACRNSYRLDKTMADSIDTILGILAREMRGLTKSIKDLNKAIEDLVSTTPEYKCLTSIPGVGPVYAAGILAEIGQIERFPDQAQLAKYAGLTWKRKQSGNFESENTKLSQTGNRYFRYYLVEAANSVKNRVPEYKTFYQRKYAETPKHKHKRALVLTARKFVRLVDTLLRNHQLYMPPKEAKGTE